MKQYFLVKDLARTTGNSVYTIKYYYKLGLLNEIGRTPHTNFKIFDSKAVSQLKKIRALRKKGRSLQVIKKLL
ncbi:MAG: MerR family transcriptional regulator [bacterium]